MVVYVKLDDYNDVMDVVSLVKERLKQAKFLISKIKELKTQEDSEIENWAAELDNVGERISIIDQTLKEPEEV